MARMKFLCDAERCIECNACVTACKNEHEVPWGINRRRVVTINDGKPGERSISVACMHCSDAPCMAVCPVDCFYQTEQGVVLTSRICASAVAIASTPVRSAHRNIRRPAISAAAARWTNAPSAWRAGKDAARNSRSTAATAWPRASCRSAPRCARPRRCWPVMAIHRRHLSRAGRGPWLRLWRLGLGHCLPGKERKLDYWRRRAGWQYARPLYAGRP